MLTRELCFGMLLQFPMRQRWNRTWRWSVTGSCCCGTTPRALIQSGSRRRSTKSPADSGNIADAVNISSTLTSRRAISLRISGTASEIRRISRFKLSEKTFSSDFTHTFTWSDMEKRISRLLVGLCSEHVLRKCAVLKWSCAVVNASFCS